MKSCFWSLLLYITNRQLRLSKFYLTSMILKLQYSLSIREDVLHFEILDLQKTATYLLFRTWVYFPCGIVNFTDSFGGRLLDWKLCILLNRHATIHQKKNQKSHLEIGYWIFCCLMTKVIIQYYAVWNHWSFLLNTKKKSHLNFILKITCAE